MKYLHTMVRVTDLDASLHFYRDALGLVELRRNDYPRGRYTLVFLAAPGDESAQIELTFNWDPEPYTGGRNFGHLAYAVEDIYT
ncbi:MAG: VOC family protein, partial [Steroidobacteraceae bacterium]